MKHNRRHVLAWRWTRFCGDVAIGIASFLVVFLLRIYLPLPLTFSLLPSDRLSFFYSGILLIIASQSLVLYLFGFYDPPIRRPPFESLRRLTAAISLQGLVLMGYFFLSAAVFPRSVLVLFVPVNVLLLFVFRLLHNRLHPTRVRRVAIVGTGSSARELARKTRQHDGHGLEVVGHVPAPDDSGLSSSDDQGSDLGPRLGSVDDLPALLAAGTVDDIVLANDSFRWQIRLVDSLSRDRTERGTVLLLPGPFESLIGRMRFRSVHDTPLVEVVRESEWHVNRPIKRLVDVVASSLLVAATLPIMIACALLVRVTSAGPVLHRQRRIGRDRRPFTIWKFRTMRPDAEIGSGEILAQPDDPRLTSIGGVLRAARLDELPQLINVLGGSMSLVGPRPERPGFVERYLEEVPGYAERFSVPPGLTGLAQINGEYDSTPQNKLRYDLAYIANWSPWLDLSILLQTAKIVLTSRGY